MNEQLFGAMNLKFVQKKRGRTCSKKDVHVSMNKTKLVLALKPATANKLGTHVRIAIAKKRIYIVPSNAKDSIAYAVSRKNNNGRSTIAIAISVLRDQGIDLNELQRFVGEYDLQFWDDLDAYFISINDNQEGDDDHEINETE